MARKRKLQWGETPWDHMTREQLLRTVQQMYVSHQEMLSVIRIQQSADERRPGSHSYWGPTGVGGAALEMGRQVEQAVGYPSEDIFRCFFRYARDLLFDTTKHKMIGSDWVVCTGCDVMLGGIGDFPAPSKCHTQGCTGTMRPLNWDDLKPEVAHA